MDEPGYFEVLNNQFLQYLSQEPFSKGQFQLASNFTSISLSVDNQIIHPARCLGMHEAQGGTWRTSEDVPFFYKVAAV